MSKTVLNAAQVCAATKIHRVSERKVWLIQQIEQNG